MYQTKKLQGRGYDAHRVVPLSGDNAQILENAGAGNLLANTSDTYYIDTGVTGSTSVNYYYIVEGTGIFGTTDPSTTVGEYDRGLVSVKKKAAPERSIIRVRSRAVSAEEKSSAMSR